MSNNNSLRNFKEFNSYPFLNKGGKSIIDVMGSCSKSGQVLLQYIIKTGICKQEQSVIDIDDFLKESGYKTKASGIKALIELCREEVIARTKFPYLYWIRKDIFDKNI